MEKNQLPILVPIPAEELWQKIKDIIHSEFLAQKAASKPVEYSVAGLTQKPLFTPLEVCKMFTISRQTLHDWSKQGLLTPYKVQRRVYFLWTDIEKLISKSPVAD